MLIVCTDGAANVMPIWIRIVQRLGNRSEWCRTDDGSRFGNAVKQIRCQKKFLRVRVYVRTCVYMGVYMYVRVGVCGWTYARPWVCAHMSVGAYARILQES